MEGHDMISAVDGLPTQVNQSLATSKSSQTSRDAALIAMYSKVEFSSAIVLVILSPITVFTNGLFLLALYQDTQKCFRKTPTTFFIAGLSLADFITGLLVEPSFAVHYFLQYFSYDSDILEITRLIYIIGGTISTIAISTSFVIVLAMSLSQYIAIRYPHKYKRIVTASRVLRLLGISALYFLGFSMLQFTGISRKNFLLLDVILHPTLISVLLVVVLILMRMAFQERVSIPALKRIHSQASRSVMRFKDKHLEMNSSLIIRSCRLSTFSTESPAQKSPLFSPQPPSANLPSGHDDALCTKSLHDNNNTSKKCLEIEIESSEIPSTNEGCDSDCEGATNKCSTSHTVCKSGGRHAVPPRETKPQDRNDKRKAKLDTAEVKNNIVEFNEDRVVEFNEDRVVEFNEDREENEEDMIQKKKILKLQRHCFLRGCKGIKSSFCQKTPKKAPIERQFAIMSFYLSAILLLSSLSHTVVFYVFLLKTPENIPEDVYVNIALRVTDLMLFIKVFLDAFIYAWRLPAYRRSLVQTITCGRVEMPNDV